MKQNILIVGGTGLIGPGVVEALRTNGHSLTVLHRGETNFDFPQEVKKLYQDRQERSQFIEKVQQGGFDIIIDLAAYTPTDALTIIEAARDCRRLFVFSTILTYGPAHSLPIHEGCPINPFSQYGKDKAALDKVLVCAHEQGAIQLTLLKPGAVFRPRKVLDGQLHESAYWVSTLRKRRPLLIADEGKYAWNLLHANDIGQIVQQMIHLNAGKGEDFVIGSLHPFTWRKFYELMQKSAGVDLPVISLPAAMIKDHLGDENEFMYEMSCLNQCYSLKKVLSLLPDYCETPLEPVLEEAIRWLYNYHVLSPLEIEIDEELHQLVNQRI